MGTGASSPTIGISVNPRVEHAQKLAREDNKTQLIDVPVLVDLPHGTVRYRYLPRSLESHETDNQSVMDLTDPNVEGPHRGNTDLQFKKGYFFHTKLTDYSTDANQPIDEADYRFRYVFRGPRCSRNKHLYYVTGNRLRDSGNDDRYTSGMSSPTWPNITIQPHDAYYNIEVIADDNLLDESLDNGLSEENDDSHATLSMSASEQDTIDAVKEKISLHILKPTTQIHLFYQQKEVRTGAFISSLCKESYQLSKLLVKLTRMK